MKSAEQNSYIVVFSWLDAPGQGQIDQSQVVAKHQLDWSWDW